MNKILLLNGPNLNMLGIREPGHYGQDSLQQINQALQDQANAADCQLDCFQSNSEQAIIEKIHQAYQLIDFIIINPAAYTHTSVAIRDALAAVSIPFVEVHLSNIYRREAFRQHSFFSDLAQGVISGLGKNGYFYALQYALDYLHHHTDRTTN